MELVSSIFTVFSNYIRLLCFILYTGSTIYPQILHNPVKNGLPEEKKALYNVILQKYKEDKRIGIKWNLFKTQKDILMPDNGETDSKKFDICIYNKLINIFECHLAADAKYALKDLQDQFFTHRNKWFHIANPDVDDATFEAELSDLVILAHKFSRIPFIKIDFSKIEELKKYSLDEYYAKINDIIARHDIRIRKNTKSFEKYVHMEFQKMYDSAEKLSASMDQLLSGKRCLLIT